MLQAWKALCELSLNFVQIFDIFLKHWIPDNGTVGLLLGEGEHML